jgi:Dolichyl-phosphate-mannose-protein mannosyltransferase
MVVALCGLIYLPSLFWSLGLDQNIFAEIGSLLLQGKKLYVDAWDVKPPNIFYTYAIFEWLFGTNGFAVRLSDYVFILIAFSAMMVATRKQAALCGSKIMLDWAAPLAAMLLALTLLSLGLADTAQTESYSLAFIIGAIAFSSVDGIQKSYRLFFTGILIAIATFFKTTNAIFLIPIVLEIFFRNREHFSRFLLYLISGFIFWSVIQIGVLGIEGSLSEYLRITFSVVAHHPNEASELTGSSIFRTVWIYVDIWSILAIAAIVTAIVRRDNVFLRAVRMPVFLLIAGIVAVVVQNKGWGYQYVVLLPGLVPLCAISGIYLYDLIRERSIGTAMVSAIIVLFMTIAITPSARRRIHYVSDALLSIRNHSAYMATLGSRQSLYYPVGTDSLAHYLSAHTIPKDEVFIFGEEPGAYWQAGRMPATRFVYSLLFTSGVISNSDLLAMKDSIVQKKPAIIVIERFDTTAFRSKPETSESLVTMNTLFRGLRELLLTDYAISDTVSKKFIIYHRKN